jgi:hypothetical protein
VAGVFGDFTAVFAIAVVIAVAGRALDDAAGDAHAAAFGVWGIALGAADAAVFRVVREHGFAAVYVVAIAVRGAGRAILESTYGGGIVGLGSGVSAATLSAETVTEMRGSQLPKPKIKHTIWPTTSRVTIFATLVQDAARARHWGPARTHQFAIRLRDGRCRLMPEVSEVEYFRVCSTCKKPIGFGADYMQCSVSTCNRNKLAQFFCSLACWDAHLPEARHRDAWAEPMKAPTREAFRREQQEDEERDQRASARESSMSEEAEKRRRLVGAAAPAQDLPKDVLVVVSKLKAYIKARSGMNTSDSVTEVLSDQIRKLCDAAIEVAHSDNRKTVLDRDFK